MVENPTKLFNVIQVVVIIINVAVIIVGAYPLITGDSNFEKVRFWEHNLYHVSEAENIIDNCNVTGLDDISYCYNRQVRQIFKYNKTPDRMSLSFDDLKTRGGDCNDWTKLYTTLFEQKNISTKRIGLSYQNTTGHAFLIAYTEEGYCLIDMENRYCVLYEQD